MDVVKLKIILDTGFITDMISAPWGLRWLAAWLLKDCEKEVVMHDGLRRMSGVSSFWADAMFRDALCWNEKLSLWKAMIVFYGVRLQAVVVPS
jgi:hypothetical protein